MSGDGDEDDSIGRDPDGAGEDDERSEEDGGNLIFLINFFSGDQNIM